VSIAACLATIVSDSAPIIPDVVGSHVFNGQPKFVIFHSNEIFPLVILNGILIFVPLNAKRMRTGNDAIKRDVIAFDGLNGLNWFYE
jgi:hypothetical protein